MYLATYTVALVAAVCTFILMAYLAFRKLGSPSPSPSTSGQQSTANKPRAIASLSTIPSRQHLCQVAIQSLLESNAFEDIYVFTSFIPERPFPAGVTHILVEKDLGPVTKVLPVLYLYPQDTQPLVVVYVDDDHKYTRHMLNKLVAASAADPTAVYCSLPHTYAGQSLAAGHAGVAFQRHTVNEQHLKQYVDTHANACRIPDDLLLSTFYTDECGLSIKSVPNYSFEYEQILDEGNRSGLHVNHDFTQEYATCKASLDRA